MLAFVEEEKPKNPEKNPQAKVRINNSLNPHMASTGLESNPAILEGSEGSHHCAIPAA